jgi:hypothetical protein
MIEIKDLFGDIKEEDYKVHFAIGGKGRDNEAPLNAFVRNEFKEWQENQSQYNFERKYVFSLIYYKKDEWMFAGIYEVISSKKIMIKEKDRIIYDTRLLDIHEDLIGRLIIAYNKKDRQSYRLLETVYKDFTFVEILRNRVKIEGFPGFEKVNVSFSKLRFIVENEDKSWKSALSNVQGVYLISDRSNGKLYIGAAYGEHAFWNRWGEYIANGGGGNVDLIELLKEKGFEHTSNFNFSILEVHSKPTNQDFITQREKHWKNVLLTKEFGYNKN